MSIPLATSFRPTLSIALSKALPIKNSRDRSVSVSHDAEAEGCRSYSRHASDQQRCGFAVSCSSQLSDGHGMPKLFHRRQHYKSDQLHLLSKLRARPTLHRSCRASERELSQYDGLLQPASPVRTVGLMFVAAFITSKSSLFLKPEAVCSSQLSGRVHVDRHGCTCFFQLEHLC